jgi:hypothetical protein
MNELGKGEYVALTEEVARHLLACVGDDWSVEQIGLAPHKIIAKRDE